MAINQPKFKSYKYPIVNNKWINLEHNIREIELASLFSTLDCYRPRINQTVHKYVSYVAIYVKLSWPMKKNVTFECDVFTNTTF